LVTYLLKLDDLKDQEKKEENKKIKDAFNTKSKKDPESERNRSNSKQKNFKDQNRLKRSTSKVNHSISNFQ
jgi:hypothetical protein